MTNDGWGKMPTEGWGKLNYIDKEPTLDMGQDAFASSNWGYAAGVHPDQTSPMTVGPEEFLEAPSKKTHEQINAEWALSSLPGANNRAAVLNSINGKQDQYTIDPDGELSNVKWIKPATDEPTGVYIMYSNGKWLNAVLSGPYVSEAEANNWVEVAFELLTKDEAFKLAFDNQFDQSQIYLASIPLAAKRHGAYGVLS